MDADAPVAPGPYRIGDGTPVAFGDAKYEWAHAGYDVLVDVARRPHGHITYQDIADAIEGTTGIKTLSEMHHWIGAPLALIAEICVRNAEPQLTALVVRAGTQDVGKGYANTYAIAGQPLPKNLQRAAAETRIECYDYFSRREAAGWDRTKLTGKPRTAPQPKKRTAAKPKPQPVAPKVCSRCRLELLPSGACGYCD